MHFFLGRIDGVHELEDIEDMSLVGGAEGAKEEEARDGRKDGRLVKAEVDAM